MAGGGGVVGVHQRRVVMCFVAHKTYRGRTGCLKLPKFWQIVEDGVENNRQDEVPGAVLVPAGVRIGLLEICEP